MKYLLIISSILTYLPRRVFDPSPLIRRCIIDMIKLHQKYKNKKLLFIIYKIYFYLLMTDVKEASSIIAEAGSLMPGGSLIPIDFFNYFYKREYIELYDEFDHRWMMFKMDF